MKLFLASAIGLGLLVGLLHASPEDPQGGAQAKAPVREVKTAADLKTSKDKTSYSIGVNIGKSLKGQMLDVDAVVLLKGIQDALAGGATLLSDAEMQAAMMALQEEMNAKRANAGQQNLKDGQALLEKNKTAAGVVALPSGLQYKVLTAGTGPKPRASDTVKTHYRGTLIDGTQFDSSYDRNEPATFGVGGVIKGWTEALQLMPVGSKWKLWIPANLAYGAAGRPSIPPNSTLIFEVELLEILP